MRDSVEPTSWATGTEELIRAVEAALHALLGQPLLLTRRAADMEMFHFGARRAVTDEIMVALQRLGEQHYEDVYASTVKERLAAQAS